MRKFALYIICIVISGNLFSQNSSVSKSWQYFYNDTVAAFPDTSLDNFHSYNPAFNSPLIPNYLGNIGLPAVSNELNQLLDYTDFYLFKPYSIYFKNPQKVVFYDTKRPLTKLKYTSGSKKEYSLNVFHSQNINEHFNLGLDYLLLNSVGQYLRQTTKNFGVTVFSDFHNHRYCHNTSFIVNKINSQLSGGIENDGYVTDSAGWNTAGIPVFLSNSSEKLTQNSISVSQMLHLGKTTLIPVNDSVSTKKLDPKLSLVHKFGFSSDYRNYLEDVTDTTFYENTYFRIDKTRDSIHFKKLSNAAGIQWNISKTESGYFQMTALFNYYISDYFNSYFWYTALDTQYTANLLSFSLTKSNYGKYKFNSLFSQGLSGHATGEMDYNARFIKYFSENELNYLIFFASYTKKQPDYYENRYCSNHFSWNNDFAKREMTELSASYNNKKKNFSFKMDYFILDNYIYFNDQVIPAQYTSTMNLMAFRAEKTFRLSNIFSRLALLYQSTSDADVISVPEYAVYNSTYWEKNWLFKSTEGKLTSQIGFDLRMNSDFYARGYDPAAGVFYSQTDKLIGKYPFIDLFLNVKLKRARFFFKLEHAGYDLLSREYFLAYHYPANTRSFRFGILWLFYD